MEYNPADTSPFRLSIKWKNPFACFYHIHISLYIYVTYLYNIILIIYITYNMVLFLEGKMSAWIYSIQVEIKLKSVSEPWIGFTGVEPRRRKLRISTTRVSMAPAGLSIYRFPMHLEQKTNISLVPNLSRNGKYNLIPIDFTRIGKIFLHRENQYSISFQIQWDMIVVTVFLLILNQKNSFWTRKWNISFLSLSRSSLW